MEWFKELWNQASTLFKWWVIILPWETGIRIRMGKKTKVLCSGIHFRIPYLDSCYKQPNRLHFVNMSPQTLTAKSGETITLCFIVGYTIKDIFKAYNSISEIESCISGNVMGNVSEFITKSLLTDCLPSEIERNCKVQLSNHDWGIEISELKVTSFAIVKTYRLIQDGHWISKSHELGAKI